VVKEQRAKVEKEGDIKAQAIMPKKRQSAGGTKEFSDDEADVNVHRGPPASASGSRPQQPPRRDGRQQQSFLQRHNEARRKQRSNWNQSWNHHRAMQENEMGRTIVGQERFRGVGGGQGPMSVMTPMGSMSRTAALLGALSRQQPSQSHQQDMWQRNGSTPMSMPTMGGGGGMMGGQGLMRTTALLQNLMGNPRPHDSGRGGYEMAEPAYQDHHMPPHDVMHDNKRMRMAGPEYGYQRPPPPIYHQAYGPPSDWIDPNAYGGPSPFPGPPHHEQGMGNPMPALSRTAQLLAAMAPPPPAPPALPPHMPMYGNSGPPAPPPPIPYDNYGGGYIVGYQQQMRNAGHAGRGNVVRDPFVPTPPPAPPPPAGAAPGGGAVHGANRRQARVSPPPPPAPLQVAKPSSAGEGKMDAGDLYAMLLATGMLPTK
jgi:hypothetical protein